MATQKLKAVIPKIIENHGNVSKSMLQVGYKPASAKNPKNVTDSKGFKEQMAILGLTEDFITKALVADIKKKPGKRFLELSLGAEILNMKKRIDPEADKIPHQTVIIINQPQAVAIKQ